MHRLMLFLTGSLFVLQFSGPAFGEETKDKPEFPPHADILKGYEKVVSTADGKSSLWTIYTRKKDGQMYAELPSSYSSQKYFFAMTISSGEPFAGLQAGDMYVYWRRFDKQLALMTPNLDVRSTGDEESKSSVKRLFTDRVITTIPIVTMGPSGGPVIDLDSLFVGQSSIFFPSRFSLMDSSSAYRSSNVRASSLITIKKSKAFPTNVEIAFEIPRNNGRLQTLHYSISEIKGTPSYKTRNADERVGYFTTSYDDYGKYTQDDTRVRYINRWSLEKADSKLKLSPPKKPIVFYIEHTTPVRYRRWVREGALAWNKAFEKIGFSNAIEVHYQDSQSGAHMEKDPEDVRYNFIRWLNNDIGTAIGPSRVNPLTGEILDADIILTDGWIRSYQKEFNKVMPKLAMSGFTPETLAWFNTHPDWDPRIRMAHPSERDYLIAKRIKDGVKQFGGHQMTEAGSAMMGSNVYDGLIGRTSQVNGFCIAADGKSLDVALMHMMMNVPLTSFDDDKDGDKDGDSKDDKKDEKEKDEDKDKKKDEEAKIDGLPEDFIGPLIADLVSHEVGHTLGLRHNFKASSLYNFSEINDEKIKGKKPFAGSVMDYIGVNINVKTGKIQGDYSMIGIGPYDEWAIQYGYTTESDLKPILARVAEPELQYATDEDLYGPDPHVQAFDLGKDPLEYAQNQIRLVNYHRKNLLEKYVKDGESWAKAREGYQLTLIFQMRAVFNLTDWIGSAFVNRDRKGDKNGRTPINVVPVQQQRDTLKFVIENAFRDEAFGLTPEIVNHMTLDRWLDGANHFSLLREEPTWPIHDKIMSMQATTLSLLLNPTTLRRVYDNEFRVPADQDAMTLPELMSVISTEIWREIDQVPEKQYSNRVPLVTSLRRNLQKEHLNRLIDLMIPGSGINESIKPVSSLSVLQLKEIQAKIDKILKDSKDKLDQYTLAHLLECSDMISKSLDAEYIYNANKMGGRIPFLILGKEVETQDQQ